MPLFSNGALSLKIKQLYISHFLDHLTFNAFPPLYQRVRAYNVMFYKTRNREQYEKGLRHLIESTVKGEMFGEWNDYGRLLEGDEK